MQPSPLSPFNKCVSGSVVLDVIKLLFGIPKGPPLRYVTSQKQGVNALSREETANRSNTTCWGYGKHPDSPINLNHFFYGPKAHPAQR